MKKLLIIVLATVFSTLSFAQKGPKTPKSPEQHAKAASEKMTSTLGLSSDQQSKVFELIKEKSTKMAELKAKYATDKKGLKAEAKPIREDFQSRMKAILTPEQYTKWEQLRKERQEKRKASGKPIEAGNVEDELMDN